jgi:hypothetical protein
LSTAIYIFIDSARFSSSCLSPTADSLWDHDAQFCTVNSVTTIVNVIPLQPQKMKKKKYCTFVQSNKCIRLWWSNKMLRGCASLSFTPSYMHIITIHRDLSWS